jgi:hypothetical protein
MMYLRCTVTLCNVTPMFSNVEYVSMFNTFINVLVTCKHPPISISAKPPLFPTRISTIFKNIFRIFVQGAEIADVSRFIGGGLFVSKLWTFYKMWTYVGWPLSRVCFKRVSKWYKLSVQHSSNVPEHWCHVPGRIWVRLVCQYTLKFGIWIRMLVQHKA